ncbi:MAG: FkbM family methyltransferase [Phycisphaerales bacterium JB063]
MKTLARLTQRFNHAFPWHHPKTGLVKRVGQKIDRTGGPRVVNGIAGSLRMKLDLASDYELAIAMNSYEMVIRSIMRRLLKPGDTFVDGGANLGVLSLIGASYVGPTGRVVAFEPQPAALARLRDNLTLNPRLTNIQLVEQGVWSEPGGFTMYHFEDDDIDGVSMGKRSDMAVAQEIPITTTRIDAVVDGPVKLIKLDVEGAELAALQGASGLLKPDAMPHVIAELKGITAQAFGYDPIEVVDFLNDTHGPGFALTLLKTRRGIAMSYDQLRQVLKDEPTKTLNVHFAPR